MEKNDLNKRIIIYWIASIVWTLFHYFSIPNLKSGIIMVLEVFILLFIIGWISEKLSL